MSHSVSLLEWQSLEPDRCSPLRGVFLDAFPNGREVAARLSQSGAVLVEEVRHGLRIEASSHVGRIDLGPVVVTIRPKINGLPLLQLLRYAYGLRDLNLFAPVDYETQLESFQDLLVRQLLGEVQELVSRGLRRQYARRSECLTSPQGRIDVNRMARSGPTATATLPCIHHPRLLDWLPNQIILAGLRLASRIAVDLKLRSAVRRCAGLLNDDVTPATLDSTTFRQWSRSRSRLVSPYESAVTLTRLLAEAHGLSLDGDGRSTRLPGVLFDMNVFFQCLLSRFLRDHLEGCEVRDERTLKGMMSYVPGANPRGRRNPSPRPDYAIVANGRVVQVLDAKYRDLWERSLPRDMLYQLAVYAMSREVGGEAVILYPTVESDAVDARIQISDSVHGRGRAFIVQRPVDLSCLADMLSNDSDADRRSYARQLVFGSPAANIP